MWLVQYAPRSRKRLAPVLGALRCSSCASVDPVHGPGGGKSGGLWAPGVAGGGINMMLWGIVGRFLFILFDKIINGKEWNDGRNDEEQFDAHLGGFWWLFPATKNSTSVCLYDRGPDREA